MPSRIKKSLATSLFIIEIALILSFAGGICLKALEFFKISTKPSILHFLTPFELTFFVLIALTAIIIHFFLSKKFPEIGKKRKEISSLLTKEVKLKALKAKSDPKVIGLFFVELAIIIVLSLSIFVYLDPETNISAVKDVPNYAKVITFFFLALIFLFIFNETQQYRTQIKQKRFSFLRKQRK